MGSLAAPSPDEFTPKAVSNGLKDAARKQKNGKNSVNSPKITVLGDEVGGDSSDDSEDEEEMIEEAEETGEEEEQSSSLPLGERTPLLPATLKPGKENENMVERAKRTVLGWTELSLYKAKNVKVTQEDARDAVESVVQALPAVVLGSVCSLLFPFAHRGSGLITFVL